ncbi:MAG TPA: ATP-binding protein, partial [Anaerolineales bacterium]|nr:ATP-binding protein [Anaerolineales bacterium]
MSKLISIPNPNRLSPPVEIYFDRENEVDLIMEFLKRDQESPTSGKVCVVHGFQGIGKTELCRVVADRLHQEFSDAQVYIKFDKAD